SGMGILRRGPVGVALVASALIVAAVLARVAARGDHVEPAVHEIRLVVRDMSYHVGDGAEINPQLRVRAGERVRVILTNTEAGMAHDFVIPDWKVASRLVKGKGSETVEFTAPSSAGAYTYKCTPHAA